MAGGGRSVVFRFLSDTTSLKKGFGEAQKGAQDTETAFTKVSGRLGGFSREAIGQVVGITAVSTAVITFATGAVKALGDEQVAAAQTGAAILSTGSAAAVTAEQVTTLADRLSKLSGVDDEVIQGGENLLLTFTNIKNGVGAGNDVFDQATKAALDMSVALGEDMSSSSIRLGKALQDPILGVTALRRVGVMLTDQQKASIGVFMANGDVMSAQKVILAELNKEFGGSAEAYGKTIPGAIGKARTAFENWSGDLAKKALPAAQAFGKAAADVAHTVGPILGDAFGGAGKVIVGVGGFLNDHKGYVIAAALAYTAFLIPALVKTGIAMAATGWASLVSSISLAITSFQVIALEIGVTNLALAGMGFAIAGAVVGLGYIIQRFMSAESKAKSLAKTLTEGLDTKSLAGAQEALVATSEELAKAHLATARHGNPIVDFLTFKGLDRHDAMKAVEVLEAQAKQLEDQIAMVKNVAKEFGIGTAEVERFAAAQGIDLSGPVAATTQKLEEQYRAQLETARGWTVYGQSAEEAINVQKTLLEAFQAAADEAKVYATALTAAQTATKDSNKVAADSIRDRSKAERDAVDTRHTAEKAALDGEFITGKASKAAHEQRVKDLDARQDAENAAADATVAAEDKRAAAIEATKAKTTLSMEEYRKAVAQNTKDTLAWMQNLALIAARGGGDFVDTLAQLGPEAAGLVAQVATSSRPEFDRFAGTMRAGSILAIEAATTQFNKLPGEVQTIAKTSGQSFADTLVHQVALGLQPLSAIVAKAAADAIIAAGLAAADAMGVADAAAAAIAAAYKPPPPRAPAPTPWQAVVTRAEGHYAEIAPAGAWRVWAEPETGGEAYIPLAPSKRGGAMAVFTQVANRFGVPVVPMASGGTWGVPAYSADRSAAGMGLSTADMGRLLGALERSGRRPVEMHNTFPQGVDPLHVARKIAWQVR
jgi:hypothetical protein